MSAASRSTRGGTTIRPVFAEPLESRTLFTAMDFDVPLPNGSTLPAVYGNHVAASPQNGYSYGNIYGFTPHVAVTYGNIAGNTLVWGKGFGDLPHAIYAKNGIIQVTFTADATHLAELESFDLGGFYHQSHVINSVEVTAGRRILYLSHPNITVSGATHTNFGFSTPLFARTMTLTINATNLGAEKTYVGLGNVVFSEGPAWTQIQGNVINDTNADQTGVGGLGGVRVYLDTNNNDKFDPGEKSVLSNVSGNFDIGQVPAGTYHVREVVPPDYRMSLGASDGYTISGRPGIVYVNNLYDTQKAVVNGTVFLDLNNDGIREPNEVGMPLQEGISGFSFQLFENNRRGPLTTAYSDPYGNFTFDDLSPGTYTVKYSGGDIFTTAKSFAVTVGLGGSGSVLFGAVYTG